MITGMNQPVGHDESKTTEKAPLSLWPSILLLIVLAFIAVGLFGVLIYLLVRGAEQIGLPPVAHVVIFVIVSAVFAWLVKRMTDIVSGMSDRWFPETENDESQGSR